MPRRTNDFQAVVYFIKRYLAPEAVVVESAMLRDRLTGEEREVDVLVSGDLGGHSLTVGIEVRDHARPQGVEWVEQMHAKHSRLPVNQTVLVSRTGFTKSAYGLADKYGIELVTPGQPLDPQGPLGDLRVQVEFKEIHSLGGASIHALIEESEIPVTLNYGHHLYTDDGDLVELVGEWVAKKRAGADMAEAVAKADPGEALLVLLTDFEDEEVPEGSSLLHLRVADSGNLVPVRKIRADFPVRVDVSQIPLKWLRLNDGEFAVGEGTFMGARALVVTTDDETAHQSFIRLVDADGRVVDLDPENQSQVFVDAEGVRRMRARGLSSLPEDLA